MNFIEAYEEMKKGAICQRVTKYACKTHYTVVIFPNQEYILHRKDTHSANWEEVKMLDIKSILGEWVLVED